MARKGIVLAGGNGTRLRPLTYVANKHLLPVYKMPMIFYPIMTLYMMGCEEIIIVSGSDNIGGFADVLKDGSDFGVKLTYRVQPEAGGIAQALGCVEGLIEGTFPVILGDNFFDPVPEFYDRPTIYLKQVDDPERFGVYTGHRIVEKPKNPESNRAVTGLYVFDDRVFDFIKTLSPSGRGELEITDVNNFYLGMGTDFMKVVDYDGFWSDMGTFDSLLEVANYASSNL